MPWAPLIATASTSAAAENTVDSPHNQALIDQLAASHKFQRLQERRIIELHAEMERRVGDALRNKEQRIGDLVKEVEQCRERETALEAVFKKNFAALKKRRLRYLRRKRRLNKKKRSLRRRIRTFGGRKSR